MSTITSIATWFRLAVPKPTEQSTQVQIGCHFEEVAEMAAACGLVVDEVFIHRLADKFKANKAYLKVNREELLDALADQIVTAVGVAHMLEMDIVGALKEVDRSNYSKFVDGKPVFKPNGKIDKGPAYTPPDLSGYF